MVLELYNPNPFCPKCQSEEIASEHYTRMKFEKGLLKGPELYPWEHLARTCKNCGYSWPEACADAINEETESGLPIVWLDKIPDVFDVISKKYSFKCPYCDYEGDSMQLNLENEKIAIEKGYDWACRNCVKDYSVRIHPKELTTVWVDQKEFENDIFIKARCPKKGCDRYYLFHKGTPSEDEARTEGIKEFCMCGQKYIIRIRPTKRQS